MEPYGQQARKEPVLSGDFHSLSDGIWRRRRFLLFLISRIGKGGLQFRGNVSVLYGAGLVVALLVGFFLMRSQPTFYLHEKAIRVVGKGTDRTDLYEDIEDLFFFMWVQFAYRSSPDVPWAFADGRIHRYAFLKENFEDLHTKYRSEKFFRAIKDGKSAIFRCLPADVALSKSIGLAALSRPWKMIAAARNMDYPMIKIELTRHHLKIEDKSIPVERIGDVKTNLWTERAQIVDVDGNVFSKRTLRQSSLLMCCMISSPDSKKDAYFMQTSTHRRRFTPESPPFER